MNVKKPSTTTRAMPPAVGIHFPREREMIATPIENQTKSSLNT